ncbi:MAG: hypothetical protein GY774_28910 [Planctomycetes bacterium]|nr:hypothetical protein [Planctomycetota bacterium]
MGHIFLFCGPPGAGKTTLLKQIKERGIQIEQLKRLTTRESRIEEGDKENESNEYYFRTSEQFAERLSKGNIANLVEWNGNYYATQFSELDKPLKTNKNYILLEDIPSAIAIKEKRQSNTTVVFIFTADKSEILNNMDFASYERFPDEYLSEWKRRLSLKYDKSVSKKNKTKGEYIEEKINRAIPDLAFIFGKIRDGCDIQILANRTDKIDEAVNDFLSIMNECKNIKPKEIEPEDIDISKMKLGEIIRNMTAPQLWKIFAALMAIISAVMAMIIAAYKLGKRDWP